MRTLCALTLMSVASVAAEELAGEYTLSIPEVGSGLLLRPDRTFEYFFIYGAADYTAKGTWRNEPGVVILNTPSKDEPPFRLVKSAAGDSSKIRVYIQAPNGRGVDQIEITVAGGPETLRAKTDEDGLAELPRNRAAKSLSIHVPVYDLDAGPFEINGNTGEFWFEINGRAITELRFRDERLKVTQDALEMTFWKADKPLRYRKQ
jgi:hypothetical protein